MRNQLPFKIIKDEVSNISPEMYEKLWPSRLPKNKEVLIFSTPQGENFFSWYKENAIKKTEES